MESNERKPPSRGIEVRLLDHTQDPIRALYLAYRVAYSALTPIQIEERIEDERITREQMQEFIRQRLETGHASPLEQVWFVFGISGVTRAFSHQFVRHHIGISFEQQSQRYVTFKGGEFPYTVPESVKKAGLEDEYTAEFDNLAKLYETLIEKGVPAEDARFVLPNATNTNFKVTVNFLELLHIADLRLCTRAQWEFRKVVALMRAEVLRALPDFGRYLQPKCGELRNGYCDESLKDWEACPIGRKRPHKSGLFGIYQRLGDNYLEWEMPETEKRRSWPASRDQLPLMDFQPAQESDLISDTMSPKRMLFEYEIIPLQPLGEDDFAVIEDEDSGTAR